MIARDGSDKRCCIIRKIKHCGMRGICCCPRGWAGHLYFSVSILEVLAVVYRFAIRYLSIRAMCQRRGTQHPQTTRFRMAIMFSKTGTREEGGMPENCWCCGRNAGFVVSWWESFTAEEGNWGRERVEVRREMVRKKRRDHRIQSSRVGGRGSR